MASVDYINKVFSNLKALQQPKKENSSEKVKLQVKKDKAHLLCYLSEHVPKLPFRQIENGCKMFSTCMELFLEYCDDPDPDTRMIADESLNRLIKAFKDANTGRIQFELYRAIKKNGPARSLRAALWRFAKFADVIQPNKCRPYARNLIPCLIATSKREEENIHDTLTACLPSILRPLGPFIFSTEASQLAFSFIDCFDSSSAVIRRCSAINAINVCKYTKSVVVNITSAYEKVMLSLLPQPRKIPSENIVCCCQFFRHLTELIVEYKIEITEDSSNTSGFMLINLLEIFELLFYLLFVKDSNVLAAALECMQSLIKIECKTFRERLTSSETFQNSYLVQKYLKFTSMNRNELCSPNDLFEEIMPQIATVEMKSVDASTDTDFTSGYMSSDSFSLQEERECSLIYYGPIPESDNPLVRSASEEELDSLENRRLSFITMNNGYAGSTSCVDGNSSDSEELIGEAAEVQPLFGDNLDPASILVRLLVQRFLISSTGDGNLKSDTEVKVSTKNLAVSCLTRLLRIWPHLMNIPLFASQQNLDVTAFVATKLFSHSDPELKSTCLNFIANVLYMTVSSSNKSLILCFQQFTVEDSIIIFHKALTSSLNVVIRSALSSLRIFLPYLFNSKYQRNAYELLLAALNCSGSTYWLVKTELAMLLSELNFCLIAVIEDRLDLIPLFGVNAQARSLEVLFYFMGDADRRIRRAAVESLTRCAASIFIPHTTAGYDFLLFYAQKLGEKHDCRRSITVFDYFNNIISTSSLIDCQIIFMLTHLLQEMMMPKSKYAIHGCISCLNSMVETYDPKKYVSAWSDMSPEIVYALSSLLHHPEVFFDLSTHSTAMRLISKLLNFLLQSNVRLIEDDHTDSIDDLNKTVEQNFGHCLQMLRMFVSPTGETKPSPILSIIPSLKKESQSLRNFSEAESKKKNIIMHIEHDGSSRKPFSSYIKLHDFIRSSYKIRKVSLNLDNSDDKFTSFLTSMLQLLTSCLEMVSGDLLNSHVGELLSILELIFTLDPVNVVLLLKQLTKVMFSREQPHDVTLFYQFEFDLMSEPLPSDYLQSFISFWIHRYCSGISQAISPDPHRENSIGMELPLRDRYDCTAVRPPKSESKAVVLSLFEPLVIKALHRYTVAYLDVEYQCSVIKFLIQLLSIGINYNLLDSNGAFLSFVRTQIDSIAENNLRNGELLMEHLIKFIIMLSVEKSIKNTIDLPDLLSKCIEVINHQEKALNIVEAIISDLMISKPNLISEDVQIQLDLVSDFLCKSVQHPKALHLLCLVLAHYKQFEPAKWKKISKKSIDNLIEVLVSMDYEPSITLFSAINDYFRCISASECRSLSILISSWISISKKANNRPCTWFMSSMVLFSMIFIVSKLPEDTVLSEWQRLFPDIFNLGKMICDLFNQAATFFSVMDPNDTTRSLLHHFLCIFLFYLIHLIESGLHHQIVSMLQKLIHSNEEIIDLCFDHVYMLSRCVDPSPAILWCNVAMFLGLVNDTRLLRLIDPSSDSDGVCSVSSELCRLFSIIFSCDALLTENSLIRTSNMIENEILSLLFLYEEVPVHSFLCSSIADVAVLEVFIKAIRSKWEQIVKDVIYISNMLIAINKTCLTDTHIFLLIPLYSDLLSRLPYPNLASEAKNIFCEKVALAFENADEITINKLKTACMANPTWGIPILACLQDLSSTINDVSIQKNTSETFDAVQNKDETWLSQIVLRTCRFRNCRKQCALIMLELEPKNILNLICSKEFDWSICPYLVELLLQNDSMNAHSDDSMMSIWNILIEAFNKLVYPIDNPLHATLTITRIFEHRKIHVDLKPLLQQLCSPDTQYNSNANISAFCKFIVAMCKNQEQASFLSDNSKIVYDISCCLRRICRNYVVLHTDNWAEYNTSSELADSVKIITKIISLKDKVPLFLFEAAYHLCRLPSLIRIIRIPEELLSLEALPCFDSFSTYTVFSDSNTLKEYLKKIAFFGWLDKTDFQFIWFNLLHIYGRLSGDLQDSSNSDADAFLENSERQLSRTVSDADDEERYYLSVLVIRTMISVLSYTALQPIPGDPIGSRFDYSSLIPSSWPLFLQPPVIPKFSFPLNLNPEFDVRSCAQILLELMPKLRKSESFKAIIILRHLFSCEQLESLGFNINDIALPFSLLGHNKCIYELFHFDLSSTLSNPLTSEMLYRNHIVQIVEQLSQSDLDLDFVTTSRLFDSIYRLFNNLPTRPFVREYLAVLVPLIPPAENLRLGRLCLKHMNEIPISSHSLLFLSALFQNASSDKSENATVISPDIDPDPVKDMSRRDAAVEYIALAFSRLKHALPSEAQHLFAFLHCIMKDGLQVDQLVNKLICEFVSPTQPYPQLLLPQLALAFNSITSHASSWLSLALPALLQKDYRHALQAITSLFVSASQNKYIRATFALFTIDEPLDEILTKSLLFVAVEQLMQTMTEEQQNSFLESLRRLESDEIVSEICNHLNSCTNA